MPVYLPTDPILPGAFPSVLAIGDSWFWYPKNNLLEAIAAHPALKDPFRNIKVLGYNGATIAQYVSRDGQEGKYAAAFRHELQPQEFQYYSALLISGGGNDAVDYKLALKPDSKGLSDPEQILDPDGLDGLLREISGAIGLLIHDVAWVAERQSRAVDVFLHGYDYPVPDGRGFTLAGLSLSGPWLKPALDWAGVDADPALRLAVVKLLIDRLNETLSRYDSPQRGIHWVDSRGVLTRGDGYQQDWDNELHPTFSGFRRIVDQRWIPVLRQAGLAK